MLPEITISSSSLRVSISTSPSLAWRLLLPLSALDLADQRGAALIWRRAPADNPATHETACRENPYTALAPLRDQAGRSAGREGIREAKQVFVRELVGCDGDDLVADQQCEARLVVGTRRSESVIVQGLIRVRL
jgi:hypothetical protein